MSNLIVKPPCLKLGSKLGIIACSVPISECSEEIIQRAYKYLQDKGFNVIEAPNCRTIGRTAGTIQERVAAIHSFFTNQEIDGILNFWGGYNTNQLLEYLDYELIRQNPKPLIGFSDTTALQIAIFTKTGLITFSGSAGITFGKPTVPEFTWKYFEKVLIKPEVPLKIEVAKEYSENVWFRDKQMLFEPNLGWQIFQKGKSEGRIMGGNLGTLLLLAGTEFWPDMNGKILFVEISEEYNIYDIERMFMQLRHMRVYEKIKGLVIGRIFSEVGFTAKDSLEMILEPVLLGYNFPVVTNVDFGHSDPIITIPIGVNCSLDADKKEIIFLESGVKIKK